MPALYMFGSNVLFFVVGVFAVYYCYGTLLAGFAATSADLLHFRGLLPHAYIDLLDATGVPVR